MLIDVLTVGGSVLEPADQLQYLGMNAVYPEIERRLVPCLLDGMLHLFFGFCHNLFDPTRMDAAVGNEFFQSYLGYLPADRVEPGKDHCLGSVVDDQIYTGSCLEGP